MSSREKILAKLRRQVVDRVELPEVTAGDWLRFDDPQRRFIDTLTLVGGTCQLLSDLNELPQILAQSDSWNTASRIYSRVPSVTGNVDMAMVSDPHELSDLDFVVYPAEFAVAENGALWLTDNDVRHRVLFFITQFLVLVVQRDDIVHTMHDAYARVTVPRPGFGLFLSGPSKTADIEQSLVIGAHGCRELQVFLV